jgi:hypothetical protein
MEIFQALVELQDRHAMPVPQSRIVIAKRFGVSQQTVLQIEEEEEPFPCLSLSEDVGVPRPRVPDTDTYFCPVWTLPPVDLPRHRV